MTDQERLAQKMYVYGREAGDGLAQVFSIMMADFLPDELFEEAWERLRKCTCAVRDMLRARNLEELEGRYKAVEHEASALANWLTSQKK